MSADNRSVSTDALATLGTIIDDTQKRDAIHLAVLPMEARTHQFVLREVLSELDAADSAVAHWVEDRQPRSILLGCITSNIRTLLASLTPPAEEAQKPVVWGWAIEGATPMTKELTPTGLCARITDYLSGGGLFNPENAIHDRVRDLLIDCRAALTATQATKAGEGLSETRIEAIMKLVDEYAKATLHAHDYSDLTATDKYRKEVFREVERSIRFVAGPALASGAVGEALKLSDYIVNGVFTDRFLAEYCDEIQRAATPPQASEGALPELPEPLLEGVDWELWGQNVQTDCYTADQMRAYAHTALAAASRDAVPEGWKQLSAKPLTDEDIEAIASSVSALSKTGEPSWEHAIARAIERAHGVGIVPIPNPEIDASSERVDSQAGEGLPPLPPYFDDWTDRTRDEVRAYALAAFASREAVPADRAAILEEAAKVCEAEFIDNFFRMDSVTVRKLMAAAIRALTKEPT